MTSVAFLNGEITEQPTVDPDELGTSTGVARHPEFGQYNARLTSLIFWPSTSQYPNVLSQAGFFYTWNGDLVKCYHCGVELKDWSENEDPWVQHVKWSPLCRHVFQERGIEYIKDVLGFETTTNPTQVNDTAAVENQGDEVCAAISQCNIEENKTSAPPPPRPPAIPPRFSSRAGSNQHHSNNQRQRGRHASYQHPPPPPRMVSNNHRNNVETPIYQNVFLRPPILPFPDVIPNMPPPPIPQQFQSQFIRFNTTPQQNLTRMFASFTQATGNNFTFNQSAAPRNGRIRHTTPPTCFPTIREYVPPLPTQSTDDLAVLRQMLQNEITELNRLLNTPLNSPISSSNSGSTSASTSPRPEEPRRQADVPSSSVQFPGFSMLGTRSMCRICHTKEVATVFLPCGHLVACLDCAPLPQFCPRCRGIICAFSDIEPPSYNSINY